MSPFTLCTKLLIGIGVILCVQLVSCKEISVDDNDLDRIEDIFADDESNSDDAASNGNGGDSYEDAEEDDATGTTTTDSDVTDPSGGLEYWSSSEKGSNRAFIGTYEKKTTYDDCSDDYWGAGLEMPSVLRGYAHGEYIDFETSLSQLVWSAIIYPDDTFDFQTRYLDSLGRPSVTLTCTCSIESDYWLGESIECACDASNDPDVCTLRYDLM